MEDEGSLKDNLGTGRPPVLDTHQRKRLKRLVNNRTGVSQRRLGQNWKNFKKKCTFLAINARKLQDIPRNKRKKIARIVPETRQFDGPRFLLRDYGR